MGNSSSLATDQSGWICHLADSCAQGLSGTDVQTPCNWRHGRAAGGFVGWPTDPRSQDGNARRGKPFLCERVNPVSLSEGVAVFTEFQPASSGFRRYRAVGVSVAAHLTVLAAIVLHNPKIFDVGPTWLAHGDGAHTYKLIYIAPDASDNAPPDAAKLIFPRQANKTLASASTATKARSRSLSQWSQTRKPETTTPTPGHRWAP